MKAKSRNVGAQDAKTFQEHLCNVHLRFDYVRYHFFLGESDRTMKCYSGSYQGHKDSGWF